MTRATALIDGNSFYCSCERVFDAKLARLPLIVLSNNDNFCNRVSAVKHFDPSAGFQLKVWKE
ncbi:hypothetical protein MBLL_03581 [Methylobacterium bullatum]|uniref:UmuC domain-containing protein n=1 Tax=Methylobacterium bullatum TaxID=570505 RepID=A0A679K7M9_9HYPH|nr:hypothetical protein MBLL_03581 [Methylobacterium bullatum]